MRRKEGRVDSRRTPTIYISHCHHLICRSDISFSLKTCFYTLARVCPAQYQVLAVSALVSSINVCRVLLQMLVEDLKGGVDSTRSNVKRGEKRGDAAELVNELVRDDAG